jgi:4-diphosphocytidyl-2C-methyl-D-erythritol kinase
MLKEILARILANINVTKPYKPHKPKQDEYHRLMRKAQEVRNRDPVYKHKRKVYQEKYTRENKRQLEQRQKFVRKQRKILNLD